MSTKEMAEMTVLSREEWIQVYFDKGYTYEEIVAFIAKNHDITITLRHLKRILKALGSKRKQIPESDMETICAAMIEEIDGSGCDLGYKSLWRRLRHTYSLNVKRCTVLQILHIIDPDGIEQRSKRKLKRRKYKVPGPNFLWHIDGYDKLKPFGFALHACIDGFSRKILWLEVSTSNNKPEIIAHYYLKTIVKYKLLPTLIRSDHGTENSLIESLQQSLRFHHDDQLAGYKSFIKGKSTSNQRIESYWSEMRRHQGIDFWISYSKDMRDRDIFNDSNEIHVQCLRYCFGPLIRYDLTTIRKEWNEHKIRKQKSRDLLGGKPNCLFYLPEKYDATDCRKPLDVNDAICLNNYSLEPTIVDPLFKEIISIVMPEVIVPTSVEEALDLFNLLVDLIATM